MTPNCRRQQKCSLATALTAIHLVYSFSVVYFKHILLFVCRTMHCDSDVTWAGVLAQLGIVEVDWP